MRKRWPPRREPEGEDPDYQVTLANERTFLAWLRTGLALLAGAVALVRLVPPFRLSWARPVLGVVVGVLGLVTVVFAYARWAANDRAMRSSRPLGYSLVLPILSVGLALVGVLVVVLVAGGNGSR